MNTVVKSGMQIQISGKIKILLLAIILIYACGGHKDNKNSVATYKIILQTYNNDTLSNNNDSLEVPGIIDTNVVNSLTEPLKGLTALYAAKGGSWCDGEYCNLTTALGLGKQGSDLHKLIIKKYLPNDRLAAFLIKQNCYLRPDGASSFNDYEYLTITQSGDTVKVDYSLWTYSHGDVIINNALDIYLYKDNVFQKIERDDNWMNN